MSLALFDLDNTLLDGDSDQLWGEYLAAHGVLDLADHTPKLEAFHRRYLEGRLDVREYLAFFLGLLSRVPGQELRKLRDGFVQQAILPRIPTAARSLLEKHRAAGDKLLLITLTNRLVTEPIAAEFGVDDLLATEPEMVDGRPTGRILGEPCYQFGKLWHLQRWLEQNDEDMVDSCFYSDSLNDLPLLEAVACPIVVNPDAELAKLARCRGWLRQDLVDKASESRGP